MSTLTIKSIGEKKEYNAHRYEATIPAQKLADYLEKCQTGLRSATPIMLSFCTQEMIDRLDFRALLNADGSVFTFSQKSVDEALNAFDIFESENKF